MMLTLHFMNVAIHVAVIVIQPYSLKDDLSPQTSCCELQECLLMSTSGGPRLGWIMHVVCPYLHKHQDTCTCMKGSHLFCSLRPLLFHCWYC